MDQNDSIKKKRIISLSETQKNIIISEIRILSTYDKYRIGFRYNEFRHKDFF